MYDNQGLDKDGNSEFDDLGFSKVDPFDHKDTGTQFDNDGLHRETRTIYDNQGYDKDGYNISGYDIYNVYNKLYDRDASPE